MSKKPVPNQHKCSCGGRKLRLLEAGSKPGEVPQLACSRCGKRYPVTAK